MSESKSVAEEAQEKPDEAAATVVYQAPNVQVWLVCRVPCGCQAKQLGRNGKMNCM